MNEASSVEVPARTYPFGTGGRGSTRVAASSLAARRSQLDAGFTLIELLVVCGIIAVITAIMLANNNKYGGQVVLQNFAYDVALSIRQAQVYGISVQRFGSGASASFANGYGMHFDTSLPSTRTSYELFADAAGTGIYTASENVPPSPYQIGRGYSIVRLCAPAGTNSACEGGTVVSKLDILFVRPEPDALIAADGIQCYKTVTPCKANARIVVQSPRGDTMSVSVESNGQIAVDQKSIIAP